LPGCQVADDFTHALGDPLEARLAAALQYRDTRTCPPPSFGAAQIGPPPLSATDGEPVRTPLRENRILYQ
jgi:hypothetical protein